MKRVALTVAARKVGEKWNAAVIVNDNFVKSLIEKDLETLMAKALVGAFRDRPEGASVNVNVVSLPPAPVEEDEKDGSSPTA